jgi:transcriptional regulator with XRE-family HTH domain
MNRANIEAKNRAAFGEKVATLRQKRGLTQDELAQKTGLSVDTIGAIEQGRRWAKLTTLHLLADGLSVSTDELLKDVKRFLV